MSRSLPQPKISIVVPLYNEEENVRSFLERLFPPLEGIGESFEVVAVDDGSADRTAALLKEEAVRRPELRVIRLARNFGQHAAILAGFESCRGDWVITIDADLQNPPEEIPQLVEAFRKGHDLVGTYRVGRRDSLFRSLASRLINVLVRRISRIELRDFGCMLRGYSREVAGAIARRREFKTFIPALGTMYASNPVEIPVRHQARAGGRSKYSLLRLIGLALDLMTGFSLWPLRALFAFGTAASILGVVFGILLLVLRLWFGPTWAAEGVFTLFAILFIFIGAQFIALGLLGEYIGRIFQEVRDRPPFILLRDAPAAPGGAAHGRSAPEPDPASPAEPSPAGETGRAKRR